MEYYNDGQVTIHQGNCLDILPQLEAESAQCVVTSPPYWGLRKYAGEQEFVWNDDHCEHEWGADILADTRHESFKDWGNAVKEGRPIPEAPHIKISQGANCKQCGAWRGAYGLEPTPEMYVDHTVEILRGIRRVLRPDGVVFWNIGDSYASQAGGYDTSGSHGTSAQVSAKAQAAAVCGKQRKPASGLKQKDLCLIPFRVALAAQADEWWVRSVIIWSKPNPMPESVKDRPSESHEYIIMLTKQARYYWDMDAVREPLSETNGGWQRGITNPDYHVKERGDGGHPVGNRRPLAGRNIRSVWEFPTQPYPEAHFAVFPEKLPERCILAATSEKGNCSKCGEPWVRDIKSQSNYKQREPAHVPNNSSTKVDSTGWEPPTINMMGWKAQCSCGVKPESAVVLDPFSGAGTTLWVAKRLGRNGIGLDVSAEYCELAVERSRQMSMQIT